VRASFFAASEASRKASHVCFLFFSTWGFSFKIYELKKASERRHSQNTDRIQVANSRPPGTRAKREEGQVYCYLTRKIDGKIAYLFSLLLLLILVAFIFLSKLYLKIFLDPPPPLMKKVFSWQSKKKILLKKKIKKRFSLPSTVNCCYSALCFDTPRKKKTILKKKEREINEILVLQYIWRPHYYYYKKNLKNPTLVTANYG
jgi:hypothetical protein